jgi:hypothetical protein
MRPNLTPSVTRGFCLGPCGNQASAAPLSRRACRPTSAESPATSLMDVAGRPTPSVGSLVLTQPEGLRALFLRAGTLGLEDTA